MFYKSFYGWIMLDSSFMNYLTISIINKEVFPTRKWKRRQAGSFLAALLHDSQLAA